MITTHYCAFDPAHSLRLTKLSESCFLNLPGVSFRINQCHGGYLGKMVLGSLGNLSKSPFFHMLPSYFLPACGSRRVVLWLNTRIIPRTGYFRPALFCRRRVALISVFVVKRVKVTTRQIVMYNRFLFIAYSGYLLVNLFQYEWHLCLPNQLTHP